MEIEISEEDAKLLIKLYKAPELKRNLHYLSGVLQRSYHNTYHRVKTLAELGFITTIRSQTGKTFYEVKKEIFEKAIEVVNSKKED